MLVIDEKRKVLTLEKVQARWRQRMVLRGFAAAIWPQRPSQISSVGRRSPATVAAQWRSAGIASGRHRSVVAEEITSGHHRSVLAVGIGLKFK